MDKEKSPQIYSAINAVIKGVGAIGKDQRNTHQNYAFRGIDDVYNKLNGLFAEHGVFITRRILDKEVRQASNGKGVHIFANVEVTYHALDGSEIKDVVCVEGADTSDKGSNKLCSAAVKYSCLAVFCIPTQQQDDADRDSPEAVTDYKQEADNRQTYTKPSDAKREELRQLTHRKVSSGEAKERSLAKIDTMSATEIDAAIRKLSAANDVELKN